MGSNFKPVSAIVVGAGFAGLATAIELSRRGNQVWVFESVKTLTNAGDVIQLASNATRVIKKWGPVLEQIASNSAQPDVMCLQNSKGEVLVEQHLPSHNAGFPIVYTNRGLAQKYMYEYALTLGVRFQFGARIKEFFEDEGCAGIYVDGQKHVADVVIAADGVHSKAHTLTTGKPPTPISSGFAVYRAWFPLEKLKGDPLLEEISESKEDLMKVWIGPDTHGIVVTNTTLKAVTCFLTHRDTYTTQESWNFPGQIEDMLKVSEGWDETLRAVIRRIPPEILIDWKLLWRDPARNWVSKLGRLVLIGDSVHPHLATSGQGGAQAIEDGATLGVLFDKAGKSNISLALKAFEKLRYERTSLTQRMGWELRHRWHQTDWGLVKTTPSLLNMPQPLWLFGADAEAYAYTNYDAVTDHILTGTPFKNTNLPEGYVHVDWTVEGMMAAEEQQANEDLYISHKQLDDRTSKAAA